MKHLDQRVKKLFFIQYIFLNGFLAFIVVFFPFLIYSLTTTSDYSLLLIGVGFIASIAANLAVTTIMANLTYKNYKYQLVDKGIKMERGVIYKKYSLIPYQKVQNIDITRGILSRMLGLSQIHIQTAGASGYYGAEIFIPGLDQKTAKELRNNILSKTKLHKSTEI